MARVQRWEVTAIVIAVLALAVVMVLGFLSGPHLLALFTSISTKLGG